MRVLFQGAGAIGIAGAALFTDAHDVAVVSRTGGPQPHAVFPRRVSSLHPTAGGAGPKPDGRAEDRIAATRRVTVTDWSQARESGAWDLVVLTTRPGELDAAVASAIREIRPRFIAITSQVYGDLCLAEREFPDAEAVIFGPAFLSERVPTGTVTPGREVSLWAPLAAPRFLIAGDRDAVRSLRRGLGRLVQPVPLAAALLPPLTFIPFVAELSIRDGDWERLKDHLRRPSDAAAEAIRARLGLPVPISAHVAHAVLAAVEAVVPIDMTSYAGRHFGRHIGQTVDMLTGWANGMPEGADSSALRQLIAELRPVRSGSAS